MEKPLALRELARDIHYAITDDGLAPASPVDNNSMREAILRVLTPERIAACLAWLPIESAPEGELVLVLTPDRGDGERYDMDILEDGSWFNHSECYEHFVVVGGAGAAGPDCLCTGPSEKAPYTGWAPLPKVAA